MTLIAHWPCQDNAANTTVVAAVGSNATLQGGDNTATISEVNGPGTALPRSLHFNGSDDWIQLPSLLGSVGTNVSVALWIKLDVATPVAGANTGFMTLGPQTSGSATHYPFTDGNIYSSIFRFTNNTTHNRVTITPPGGVTRTDWHHVAITNAAGANGYKFYVNGAVVHQTTGNALYFDNDLWAIGRTQAAAFDYYLDGRVCDVQVYDGTLSGGDIAAIIAAKDLAEVTLADTDVAPFDVFTAPVTAATDVGALTLSAGASGYDWSGIAWRSDRGGSPLANCSTACTLISLNHGVSATHCGPIVGDLLDFRSPDGTLRTHVVAAVSFLDGDVRLVRFASSPHASLARYPIVTSAERLTDLNWWCPQQDGQVALSRCRDVLPLTVGHIDGGWGVAEFSSGRPSLIPLTNGGFALLGTAWLTTDHANVSAQLPAIQAALGALGESAETFEVPSDPNRLIVRTLGAAKPRLRIRGGAF